MSAQRLSIVLATPPGFNPGMAATELALHALLRKHNLTNDATCYRMMSLADRLNLLPAEQRVAAAPSADTGLTYHSAFDDLGGIMTSKAVLYWADFLHMAAYVRHVEELFARDGITAGVQLSRLLLLEDADDAVLARAVSFGTTLLFNTLREERDAAYAQPLRRFLKKAKRVWVRDALSAARVAHLRNDYETGYFGVDCALLLSREDVLRYSCERRLAPPRDAGAVLAFFGREPQLREQLLATALELGRALDRPVRWLRWGDRGAFPNLQPQPQTLLDSTACTVHELLYEVAHASAVVTDTYHLAVAAWSFGVPAVSGFPGRATSDNDVSSGAEFNWRDKREVFYSQYDALDFLIRPEELLDSSLLRRRWAHIHAALSDPSLPAAIAARIRAHAAASESSLATALAELLAAAPAGC